MDPPEPRQSETFRQELFGRIQEENRKFNIQKYKEKASQLKQGTIGITGILFFVFLILSPSLKSQLNEITNLQAQLFICVNIIIYKILGFIWQKFNIEYPGNYFSLLAIVTYLSIDKRLAVKTYPSFSEFVMKYGNVTDNEIMNSFALGISNYTVFDWLGEGLLFFVVILIIAFVTFLKIDFYNWNFELLQFNLAGTSLSMLLMYCSSISSFENWRPIMPYLCEYWILITLGLAVFNTVIWTQTIILALPINSNNWLKWKRSFLSTSYIRLQGFRYGLMDACIWMITTRLTLEYFTTIVALTK